MEEGFFRLAGVGPRADMPVGATTGESDLPSALEVSWDATQVRINMKAEFIPVLEVVSPPVIVGKIAHRAGFAVSQKYIERLSSSDKNPYELLDFCLSTIRAKKTFGPQPGVRHTNWWWLVHDSEWLPCDAVRPLQEKWCRQLIEFIAKDHPKRSDILAIWDRWIAANPKSPYGKKKAGSFVIAPKPYCVRNGCSPQVFELRASAAGARGRLLRYSGEVRYDIDLKLVEPVCEASLEDMGVSPVVGYAAMLANHCVQGLAAPSAHARLDLEVTNSPLLEKSLARFEAWRAGVLSHYHCTPEHLKQNLIHEPLDAAIQALVDFTGAKAPTGPHSGEPGTALDPRAQEFCDALFALKEVLATTT